MQIRLLDVEFADEAARVHRASFDEGLPWLVGLHTPDEDRAFYRDQVFRDCRVFGAFNGMKLIGIMALREGWIDQLYVLPQAQGQGVGAALLTIAQEIQTDLSLWTFQRNAEARRFYERHSFVSIEETDGSANEEREPDVRYRWQRLLSKPPC